MKRKKKKPRQVAAEYREAIIYFLLNRDGWQCAICERPFTEGYTSDMTIDHIHATSRGGKHRLENFQLAHMACNLLKFREVDSKHFL